MAKRNARDDSSIPTISRGSQSLIGAGFVAIGALTVFITISIGQGDAESRARALKEQAFVQTTCTVEEATTSTRRDAEGSEYTNLSVTFKLETGGRTFPGLSYIYPDYAYTKESAKKGLGREFAPGASIACFYDKENPQDAVLMLKAMPTEDPPNPIWAWMFGATGGILVLLGLYVAFSNKKWKLYSEHDVG
jgi:hypothetical protein